MHGISGDSCGAIDPRAIVGAGFRRFPRRVEHLAEEWFRKPVTQETWAATGFRWESESNPFEVASASGVGVAKPGTASADGVCRAAHEKIASDLAYLLGLPVPPVVLWDRGESCRHGEDQIIAISARAFPQAEELANLPQLLIDERCPRRHAIFSAMHAFEVWISAGDRKLNHVLVDIASTTANVRLAFIDYASALSAQWLSYDSPIGRLPTYGANGYDRVVVGQLAQCIVRLDENLIRFIVARIPIQVLPPAPRDIIIDNLLRRKRKLASILEGH